MKDKLEIIKKYIDIDKYNITFKKGSCTLVCRDKNHIEITYKNPSEGLFAIGVGLMGNSPKRYISLESEVGIMVDCARNGVMKVSSLKKMIVYCALLGYTKLYLYIEDCVKVEGEEHFGYMRGAYTKEELCEIDNFANSLNVKVVPCIETLAHLNQIFDWAEYKEINDTNDILLVDKDRTYELIENIVKRVSECFSSGEINIGMDEVELLGKGKFLRGKNFEEPLSIFTRHLVKVKEICDKYHLKVSMWGDMFFSSINGCYYNPSIEFDEKIKNAIPEDVKIYYWDYYHSDENYYKEMISAHKKLHGDIGFAGGLWSWKGFAPYNNYSLKTMIPAIDACKKSGIKEIMFTMWGDDGAECSKFALLPAITAISCYIHLGDLNILKDEFLMALTGYNYEELLCYDLPNKAEKQLINNPNPCKYIFYDDIIAPSFMGYIHQDMIEIYRENYNRLCELSKKCENEYSLLFKEYASLCKIIYKKIEVTYRIFDCYHNQRDKLPLIKDDIEDLINCINEFYKLFRSLWNVDNKPFGFEIQDIRIGGLIQRLKDVNMMIDDLSKGKINKIDALDEKLFTLNYNYSKTTNFNYYSKIVSRNKL